MNKEKESIYYSEQKEVFEKQQEIIDSSEEVRKRMLAAVNQEIASFESEGKKSLALYDARARQEGLIIDNYDKQALLALNLEIEEAKEELEKTIETERANVIGVEVMEDDNFENSIIVKVRMSDDRIVGFAIRKNKEGDLVGNEIRYMRDGSVGAVYQLHEANFIELEKSGVVEAYENALAKEKERSVEKRADSGFKESLLDVLGEGSSEINKIGFFEKASILVGGASIENQQIDVIKNSDGSYRLNFKLTNEAYEEVKKRFENVECNSKLSYDSIDGERKTDLVDCWKQEMHNITAKISAGKKNGNGEEIRCALGLVEIIIENNKDVDDKQLVSIIDRYLSDGLGILKGLDMPTKKEEREYKSARYLWQHKLGSLPENFEDIERNMKRQEVFPGYSTIVEEGKHKEYQEKSPYAVFHKIYSVEHLPTIIKAGGLIATHERIKRGIAINGKSSAKDIETGGGDSVFTRIITKDGIEKNKMVDLSLSKGDVYFLFDNDILDRTDWYAYEGDRYGSTNEDSFLSRQSPEQVFEDQKDHGFCRSNEQMFRTGISADKIKTIACSDVVTMKKIYRTMMRNGIYEINDVPVEKLLVVTGDMKDFISLPENNFANGNSYEEVLKQYKQNIVEIVSLENEREQEMTLAKNKFDADMKGILREKKEKIGVAFPNQQTDDYLNSESVDLYIKVMNVVVGMKDSEKRIEEINQRVKYLDTDIDEKSLADVVNFEFVEELKNGTDAEKAVGEKFLELEKRLEETYASALEKNSSMNFLDIIDLIENDINKYV